MLGPAQHPEAYMRALKQFVEARRSQARRIAKQVIRRVDSHSDMSDAGFFASISQTTLHPERSSCEDPRHAISELAFLYEERGYRFLEFEIFENRPRLRHRLLNNDQVIVRITSERAHLVFFGMRHVSGKRGRMRFH